MKWCSSDISFFFFLKSTRGNQSSQQQVLQQVQRQTQLDRLTPKIPLEIVDENDISIDPRSYKEVFNDAMLIVLPFNTYERIAGNKRTWSLLDHEPSEEEEHEPCPKIPRKSKPVRQEQMQNLFGDCSSSSSSSSSIESSSSSSSNESDSETEDVWNLYFSPTNCSNDSGTGSQDPPIQLKSDVNGKKGKRK